MAETITSSQETIDPAFDAYRQLFNWSSAVQPHSEGMTQEEFQEALENSQVKKSIISSDENAEVVEVPQLCPIDAFTWLNADFYENNFPEEFSRGDVMHFAAFNGVDPSEEVRDRLIEVARAKGVIAIDYPGLHDQDYPARAEAFLQTMGIRVEETVELGTQTYVAGQVTLKRDHERLPAPLGLIGSFSKQVEDGTYDISRQQNGASLLRSLDAISADNMKGFWNSQFEKINKTSPVKQSLTPEEFEQMVTMDTEVAKIVASQDGEISALCIMAEDVTKFDWVNPEYFASIFPERTEQKQVIYFPALAADPDPTKLGQNTEKIVELIAQLVETGDNEIVVAFDCCDENKDFLPAFLEAMINDTPEANISFKTLGVQKFLALRTTTE